MARRAKRLLALLLALMMCVSLLPATALAEGEGEAAGTIRLADAPDGENGAGAPAPEKSDPEALPEEAAAGDIPIDEAHFPDKAFRAYVSENLDTDGDGALSETERAAVTSIEVSDKGMEDLTGIEYFPAVTYLNCRGNNLPALNVSSIPDLTYLDCSFNSLAELDVRANTALANLNCSVNALAELDVSANTALTVLDCSSNHLTSLDVSANTALRALYCSDNSLAELDVSANTSLQQLSCKSNGLAALYVHANTKLRNLYCYNTQITALDISSNEALVSAFLTGTRTEEETDGGFIRYNSVKGELAVDATVSVITEPSDLASGQCGDDLTWTLSDDYTLTITGTGDMWDFPWSNEQQTGDTPWAQYTKQICRLVVDPGVTSIGGEAFEPCSSLNDVELPDTLIRLGDFCFAGAAFSKISLPASLETIEYGAFSGCQNLTDAYYDGTMDQWGQISIYSENSWLQRATIHCTDGNIDNSDKCGDDLTWSFDEETGTLTIIGIGDMWNSPMPWDELKPQITRIELSEDLTSIGNWVFENCTALTSLELPANVARIGAGAFYGCTALTDLVLPKKLEEIGYGAFEACSSLTAIVIPACVTWISNHAFSSCSGLKEITFEGSAPTIWGDIFENVTATANYPSNYPGWTEDVLQDYGGSITWVPYEKEVAVLDEGKCGDDLTWTMTDDGVLTISGTGDMYNYEWEGPPWSSYRSIITTVLLPDGLTGIGDSAFTDCSSLADIEIPAGVTYIGYYAFFSCQKLPSVTIPAGVTIIHSDTFAYCSALTSITIPASVTEIEPYAFNSSGLTEITFEGGAPTIWEDIFENVTATANYPSNYPGWTEDVLQDYGGSITWVPYEKEVTVLDEGKCGDKLTWKLMDDGTMTISGTGDMWDFVYGGEEAAPWARYTAGIYCLVVDEGVTGIGNEAFYTCGRLAAVELPATLVSVGDYAFDECGALTDVYYGGTIAQWEQIAIGTYNDPLTRAAIHCSDGDVDNSDKCGHALTWSLDENGTLTVTGTGEMWDYYNKEAPWVEQRDQIRKVVLEPGVTSVSRSAFWGCPNLTEIVLPEGLTYLGQFCFRECPGLVTVDLPASLVTMDQGEFSECPNLVAINAAPGGEYKTVGGVLFTADMKTLVAYPNGLNGVNGVYQVPDGVTTLGPRAFYGSAKLTEIKLPDSVVEFGYNEFQRCHKLEAVNIPNGVTTLYISTFYDCTSLKSLTIPASVTLITDYAFCNCTSLKEIRFEGSAPEIEWWDDGTGLFQNVTATAYYPANDASWTEEFRDSLGQGGDITWVPYEPQPENPFTDVKEGKYYYEPVLWAYYHDPQITTGTTATTFGPNDTCTRGQVVTFLWRAKGCPEPTVTAHPFTDVKESAYYYKAMLWAVENGITSGTSATTFGPNENCTRSQVVTFLWRADGKPEPMSSECPFTDIKTNSSYYKAVLWAVENGITSGTSATTFGPKNTCTRGQIVTFLYRYVEG